MPFTSIIYPLLNPPSLSLYNIHHSTLSLSQTRMWMVDSSNSHTKQLTMPTDPIYGRKLRPLMPRPITGASTKNTPYSSPSCCCIRNPNILQWNHPMCGLSDYGVKREIQSVPLVSTRWNPTPEQLQALEEMYRRGIRTPSAEQIQQIAAKLRRFGKIEGKNVFYWFQNHKARERQKKRRQLELLAGKKNHHPQILQPTETGLGRKSTETEHQKLPTISNCNPPPEDSLQHKILSAKNEECWHLDFSPSLSPPAATAGTAAKATAAENDQTLQLFPVGRIGLGLGENAADYSMWETKFRPNEFIEFLPTKK